jgi:hypothetical protein
MLGSRGGGWLAAAALLAGLAACGAADAPDAAPVSGPSAPSSTSAVALQATSAAGPDPREVYKTVDYRITCPRHFTVVAFIREPQAGAVVVGAELPEEAVDRYVAKNVDARPSLGETRYQRPIATSENRAVAVGRRSDGSVRSVLRINRYEKYGTWFVTSDRFCAGPVPQQTDAYLRPAVRVR